MASQRAPRSRCPGAAGVGGMTFAWEGAAPGPKGTPLPHPWPGSLYLRSLDGCTGGSHQPGSDSAAACQTQSRPAAMARVPSPNRPPQPRSPRPRPEPGLPPHPAPSVPAQRVKPRRGEPQASYRKTHRGTVGQILMEQAFRMGEMWREGWGRRGTSHLGQKPQVQRRTRSPWVKQRFFLSPHPPFLL